MNDSCPIVELRSELNPLDSFLENVVLLRFTPFNTLLLLPKELQNVNSYYQFLILLFNLPFDDLEFVTNNSWRVDLGKEGPIHLFVSDGGHSTHHVCRGVSCPV